MLRKLALAFAVLVGFPLTTQIGWALGELDFFANLPKHGAESDYPLRCLDRDNLIIVTASTKVYTCDRSMMRMDIVVETKKGVERTYVILDSEAEAKEQRAKFPGFLFLPTEDGQGAQFLRDFDRLRHKSRN